MISSRGRPRSLKGKERALSQDDKAEQLFTYTSHAKSDSSEDDEQSFGDYESALEAALGSDDLDEQGHEKTFIYTGDDDEEMHELRELAHSSSIAPKNGRVTQAPSDSSWRYCTAPGDEAYSVEDHATLLLKRSADSLAMKSLRPASDIPPPPQHNNGDDLASMISPPTPSAPSKILIGLDRASSLPVLPTQIKAPSLPNGLPYRRPPMNPLVSRLRSTPGVPSALSGNNSRSVSQTSLASSLGLANGRNGFANESPRNSFYDSPNAPGSSTSISRRSSVSRTQGQSRHDHTAPSSLGSAPTPTENGTKSFHWVTLSKITQRLRINRSGTRESLLGMPTVMTASGIICVGTEKGWVMVFDYSQTLRCVCGNDVIVRQCGTVTALAISTDQTYLAVGHATGYIHLYALNKPGQPSRTVTPVTMHAVQSGKTEGHVAGYSSGCFLNFVGDRHTALVSGDQTGLAFFHSLGKVLGLLSTDILRILGKYPLPTLQPLSQSNNARLLAMQALPLGTSAHSCDKYHLVALLTRSKLVMAGLKPSARTWWRCTNKHLNIEDGSVSTDDVDGMQSGSLAWRPSVDGKPPLLAFCWSKRLHIVRVSEAMQQEQTMRNGDVTIGHSKSADAIRSLCFEELQPTAQALPRRRQNPSFVMPSAVCSLTWINHRTLFIVTHTHIHLFDIHDLQIYDSAPLATYYLVFKHARPGETLNICAYKARLFALCTDGVRIGNILTWADRMLELVEKGDVIAAIIAATSYMTSPGYTSGQLASLALPASEDERFAVVSQRLRDLLPAASEYVFSEDRLRHAALKQQSGLSEDFDDTQIFIDLVSATCRATMALGEFDFLFEDLAEQYSANGLQDLFLESIESFVISQDVISIPVATSQKLMARLANIGDHDRLAQLILALKPECLDLNQVTKLCLKYSLWDALIHVYTEAIHDYVGPMIELFKLIADVQNHRDEQPAWSSEADAATGGSTFLQSEAMAPHCYRIFDYLTHILTGLSANGLPLPAATAMTAKSDIWSWLLALHVRRYPSERDPLVLTTKTAKDEPLYPYLMLLLRFDAEATLSFLDAAFEDSFLDRDDSAQHSPHYDRIDRQAIVDMLLSLLQQPQSTLLGLQSSFLYIFIARNLPKYPQFLQLSVSAQIDIIDGLVQHPEMPDREDRELAVEFVLSAFTGEIDDVMLRKLEDARFYRALASLYRRTRQYQQLAATLLRDPYGNERIFDDLREAVRGSPDIKEKEAVLSEITSNARHLVELDTASTVFFIQEASPEAHDAILTRINDQPLQQMIYLACLLENPSVNDLNAPASAVNIKLVLHYVSLLCNHNAPHVVPFLQTLKEDIMPPALDICKRAGAVDALVWSEGRDGNATAGISVLAEAMQSKAEEITASLIHGLEINAAHVERLVAAARIAVQLSVTAVHNEHAVNGEKIFASLISVLVNFQRTCSLIDNSLPPTHTSLAVFDIVTMEALSALISGSFDFPSFFAALASRSVSATYAEYRTIVSSIIEAYRFEGELLSMTRNLIKGDLYAEMMITKAKREAGFRPLVSGLCSICDLPVWVNLTLDDRLRDPDVTSRSTSLREVSATMSKRPSVRRRPSLKGKETDWVEETGPIIPSTYGSGLVLFRGGSCFHTVCLQNSKP